MRARSLLPFAIMALLAGCTTSAKTSERDASPPAFADAATLTGADGSQPPGHDTPSPSSDAPSAPGPDAGQDPCASVNCTSGEMCDWASGSAVCKCTVSPDSCVGGKSCNASSLQCEAAATCSPPCSGTAPSCLQGSCMCASSSCNSGDICANGVCIPSTGVYALPGDRMTLWQPGVTYAATSGPTAPAPGSAPSGWVAGIPARSTICATVNPSNDKTGSADTTAIQTAIDHCPANQTVKLGAGTFTIYSNQSIAMKSYVTVRGTAVGQVGTSGTTVVTCSSPGNCVLFSFGGWAHDSESAWMQQDALAGDAQKGAFSVRLANATSAVVGEIVSIDEQYDSALTYYNTDQGQTDDYLGWGENRKPGLGSQAADWAASRPIGQAMEIASIDTSAPYSATSPLVTFTAPFNRPYRVSQAAHLARLTYDGKTAATTVQWAGLEDVTLVNGSAGDAQGNVAMYVAKYSWIKNIESHGGDVMMMHTYRCELRDSFIHTGETTTYGGGAYGIVIDTYAASNLVENNISWSFNKVMLMRSTGGGNVIGYNYMEDGYGSNYGNCQPNWSDESCSGLPENGLNASHMATPHEELFEGNQAWNGSGDSTWGNSINITFFRNHFTATRRSIGNASGTESAQGSPPTWCNGDWSCAGPVVTLQDDGNRRAAGAGDYHYDYSFVGNVLGYPSNYLQTVATPWPGHPYPATFHQGEPGWTSQWQYEALEGGASGDAYAWNFGTGTLTAGPGPTPGLLRDGNYDYITSAVHWHGIGGSGQTSGLAPPPVSALPNSLYIPSNMQPPAFFGAGPWPWIDGSNASNPIPGRLPARTRFDAGTPNG